MDGATYNVEIESGDDYVFIFTLNLNPNGSITKNIFGYSHLKAMNPSHQ
jgi:hypothetical protein